MPNDGYELHLIEFTIHICGSWLVFVGGTQQGIPIYVYAGIRARWGNLAGAGQVEHEEESVGAISVKDKIHLIEAE